MNDEAVKSESGIKLLNGFLEEDLVTSPCVDELFAALAHFQSKVKAIVPTGKYELRSKPDANGNTRFLANVSFATFDDLHKSSKEALAEAGLSVVQPVATGRVYTVLAHKSGQWMRSVMALPVGASKQELGIFISFARRYSYSAILGLVTEDAEPVGGTEKQKGPSQQGASGNSAPTPQRQQPKPAPPSNKTPFKDANLPAYIQYIVNGKADSVNAKLSAFTFTKDQRSQLEEAAKEHGVTLDFGD